MNWADLIDWAGRILGGLAALVGLGLLVVLLGNLGKVFGWLGRTLWSFARWLVRLVRSPRLTLLEGVEQSTLFALVLFPFIWLYGKIRLWSGRKAVELPDSTAPTSDTASAWPEPPPWNEAPSLADSSTPLLPQRPVPAPLAELVRLWEHGFDLQPLRDLPDSETFILSYYAYPQLWEPDAPSILVEATTPYNDQRWRLVMPSGKDVLCIEIDEAEFLAWWRQTRFDDHGEMDLMGWLRVSELTMEYCEAHRYPIWRFVHEHPTPEDKQRWREGLIDALAAYHDAVLYARHYDWSAATVFLWREEIVARHWPLHAPDRDWQTQHLRPAQSGWAADAKIWLEHSQPVRLIDLLQTDQGADGLVSRMERKSMPPYRAEELADVRPSRYVWLRNPDDTMCLVLEPAVTGQEDETVRVRFPRAWTANPDWPNLGPFSSLRDRFIVTNADGLSGLIDLQGRFTVPCRYAYLDEGRGSGGSFEIAEALEPDSRGEKLCDLIDGDGRRINPSGLKVLAGTLRHDGCVVTTDDDSQPLRLDWMDNTGVVRKGDVSLRPDELRWSAISPLAGDRRLVRCPDSGLWGYQDKTGAVASPPAFHETYGFGDGLAKVGMEPDKLGLIGLDGTWRIPPVWKNIWPESRQCYVVENEQGEYGAINPSGEVIVSFRTLDDLTKDAPQDKSSGPRAGLGEDFDPIELVMRQWRQNFLRKRVDEAKAQDSLASLEGVFDSNARTSDLEEAGVWFMPVCLLRDKSEGLLRPKAGETGHVFAEYPVSLSIFDLSVEAPVAGLARAPEAIVGVRWRDLVSQ
jgi:hypothetical protein